MPKIRKNLASWVLIGYGFAGAALMGNNAGEMHAGHCQENIVNYQKISSSIFHTRQARAEHLVELIKNSSNKFQLINELYLHYRSISHATSELSRSLELCLLDLLNIAKHDPELMRALSQRKFFKLLNPVKFQDPVHEFIAGHIVNLNFYSFNMQRLERLMMLDKLETGWFTNLRLTKADFDEALAPPPSPVPLKRDPEFLQKLLLACEQVMAVDYYGHSIFVNFNLGFVQNVLDLVGDSISTKNLRNAVASYLDKPTALSFDHIRVRVRELYQEITGERIARSPSEYWGAVLSEVERIKRESIAEAKQQAQRFRMRPQVQRALLAKKDLDGARERLEKKIALSELHEFAQSFQSLATFSPDGLGLFWSANDIRSFIKLATTMRSFVKSADRRTQALDEAIGDFDGSRAQLAVLKAAAKSIGENIKEKYDNYQKFKKEFEEFESLIFELEKYEKYGNTVKEDLEYKIRRAISNSFFRDLKGAKASAQLMIQALGEPHEEIRHRINAVFLEQSARGE